MLSMNAIEGLFSSGRMSQSLARCRSRDVGSGSFRSAMRFREPREAHQRKSMASSPAWRRTSTPKVPDLMWSPSVFRIAARSRVAAEAETRRGTEPVEARRHRLQRAERVFPERRTGRPGRVPGRGLRLAIASDMAHRLLDRAMFGRWNAAGARSASRNRSRTAGSASTCKARHATAVADQAMGVLVRGLA